MLWSRVTIGLILGVSSVVLADAKSDYEMLFGEEAKKVAATPDTKDDAKLAAKVLTAAKMATDAPKSQIYFYQKAYELGIRDVDGHPSALEALGLLEQALPKRRLEWQSKKLKVVEAAYQRSRGAARQAAAKAYLEILLSLADAAAAGGKDKEAWELYRKAYPVAAYVRSPQAAVIAKKIKEMSASAAATTKRTETLKLLMGKLAADPRDIKARTELIYFCIAELNEPAKAASLVAEGVDEKLVALVTLAGKKVEQVPIDACLELGNWYYESLLGKASDLSKVLLLRRAAGYYQRYLALYTKRDVKRLNASLVLEEINKKLAELGQPGSTDVKITATGNGCKGTVYACGDDEYELRINSTVVLTDKSRYRAKSAEVELKAGDVIAVKLVDAGGSYKGFCLLFQGKEDGIEFATDIWTWSSYVPKDKDNWWLIETSSKSPMAAKGTSLRLPGYVVKQAQRPLVGMCMSIWGTGSEGFVYHVVTAADVRKLKWVSKDATYVVSSKLTTFGRPVEPKEFLLTGEAGPTSYIQYAFVTSEEAKPNIVISLKQIAMVKRILIENRRRRSQDKAAGLTVWVSSSKIRWTKIWTAADVQDWWRIDLKSSIRAKYVKIGLPGTGTLHLASVKIFGDAK